MNNITATAAPRAADFVVRYAIRLTAAAERLLDGGMSPPEYYQALRAAGLEVDARRVLAYSMPKRRALWWGAMCAWDGLRDKATPDDLALLETVMAYIRHPSDELRRSAWRIRRHARKASPTAPLAGAAFFSAGSVSTLGNPAVAAPDHLTGRLVSVAVYLSAAVREPRYYRTHLRHYLSLGEEIARGKNLWAEAIESDSAWLDETPASDDARLTASAATPHFMHTSPTARRVGKELAPSLAACGCCSPTRELQGA